MKKTLFILLAFILVISLMLVACKSEPTTTATTGPTTTTSKPPTTTTAPTTSAKPTTTTTAAPTGDKYGGIWTEALSVAPSRPIGYPAEFAPDSGTAAAPALESLISIKIDGTVVPRLATSYTQSADGTAITLSLRKGVKFHDGSDFNADVALWNMNLVFAAKQSGTATWKSLDKVDDYTIRVNFTQPGNINLVNLAGGTTQMISKAFVDKNGVEASRWNPIGTGAFIFKSYEKGSKITYARNPSYWDPVKPYLDGIVMSVIADSTVRKLAFQKGDVNRLFTQGLDAVELKQAGYTIKTLPGGTFAMVPCSGVAASPWSNINVRLAASYALDREALAKALGFGFLNVAYQIYPGYDDTRIKGLLPTTFNVAKAKDLLAQAGYPTGFKTTIHSFSRVVPNDYTTAVAAQLRTIGLDVTTDFPEAGAYDNLRYGGWSDGIMNHGYIATANHNQLFTFYFIGTMFPSVKKPAGFIEAVNASLATPAVDPAAIQAALQLLYDNMTVIPYVEQTQIAFYKKGSNDPNVDTFGITSPVYMDLWIDKNAR